MDVNVATAEKPRAQRHTGGRKWYREPWPWILMAGPAVVVVAGFVTLWLAVRSEDGLVADDYYKQGLAINKTLARDERARILGLHGNIEFDARGTALHLAAREGITLPPRLNVIVSHATRQGFDHTLSLQGADGVWRGAGVDLRDGHWLVIVEDEARTWRLSGTLHTPGERLLALGGGARE